MTPAIEPTSFIWQFAERFGFPAATTVCLVIFLWIVGRGVIAELGRLTRAVSLCVLAMQFAPELHDAAHEVYDESEAAAKKRKEDLESEKKWRKPPLQ